MELAVKTAFLTLFLYFAAGAMDTVRAANVIRNMRNARLFKKGKARSLLSRLDKLAGISGIGRTAPFFNVCIFILLTIVMFTFAFLISFQMTRTLLPALAISIAAGCLPKAGLELLRILNIRRVRRNYHGFLNALAGFYSLTGDIVGAFRRASDYTAEPLKTYVKEAVYKYDKSSIGFDACLDELGQRAGERELLKLLKFTKICLLYGGDYLTVLEKLNRQSQRLENERLSLYTSAYVGIVVILAMVFIDLVVIAAVFMKDRFTAGILTSTILGNSLISLNLAAVTFGIYTCFRLFKAGGGG